MESRQILKAFFIADEVIDSNIELEDENDEISEAIIYGGCIYGFTLHGKLVMTKNYPVVPMRFENSIIEENPHSKQITLENLYGHILNELMVLIQRYSHLSNVIEF